MQHRYVITEVWLDSGPVDWWFAEWELRDRSGLVVGRGRRRFASNDDGAAIQRMLDAWEKRLTLTKTALDRLLRDAEKLAT